MLIHIRHVPSFLINRLQSNVLREPYEPLHDSCRLPEVLGAAPAAFTKASLSVLTMDEVLIDAQK